LSPFAKGDGSRVKAGIGFTGHYGDKESSLYYARARFYNPDTGRFITSDPIQDPSKRYSPAGLNRYVYGLNNPLKYWDPDGENPFAIFTTIFGFITGTISGIINFTQTGNAADIFLGMASGTASGFMNGFGIPISISLSTRGFSAGVGFGIGNFNAGVGFHSDWSGQNYGFNVSAGVGTPGSPGVGLSFGMDYRQGGGWNTTIGANISVGFDKTGGTTLNMGTSVSFNEKGISGGGWNIGVSQKSEATAGGNYSVFGGNIGVNFDQSGATMNMGVNLSSVERIDGTHDFMSFNNSYGVNIGSNGSVTPYANSSASRYMEDQGQREMRMMTEAYARTPAPGVTLFEARQMMEQAKQLSRVAFNEYGRLDWILNNPDVSDSVKESVKEYLKDNPNLSKDEIRQYLKQKGVFLPGNIRRLSDSEISKLGLDPRMFKTESNMEAGLYQDTDTGKYILAYKGTQDFENGGLSDWINNFGQGLGFDMPQYKEAKILAIKVKDTLGVDNLIITGQSLGGGLASAAGVVTGARTFTFDASGLNPNTVRGYAMDFSNITAYDIKGELLWYLQGDSRLAPFMPDAVGHRVLVNPVSQPDLFWANLHDPVEIARVLNAK
jgi:RHS repeat-associated protein